MTTPHIANVFGGAVFTIGVLLGSVSGAVAVPTIDGIVTLGEYSSVQTVQFAVEGGGANVGAGQLYLSQDGAGNVYFALVQPISLNSNTYGTTSVGGLVGTTSAPEFNWSKAHTLDALLGSDMANFQFYNTAGSKVFDFNFDYLSKKTLGSAISYITCGDLIQTACVTASGASKIEKDEGAVNTTTPAGQASWLTQYATSASYDLLNYPSYTVDSPTPTQQPGWVNADIYEGEVLAAAFGGSGFGGVAIPLVHDSPPNSGDGKVETSCTAGALCVFQTQLLLTSVPEPSSLAQMLAGLAGLQIMFYFNRRRRRTPGAGKLLTT